ncbi:MAG: acyl-CoA dehydrogenase family protein [Myxococcota bacterium]|nr:acyl-CoA dehydrogenase family protein [Myxococcota bacterium]
MSQGLDRESLDLVLESFQDFAKQRLPDEVLLDFDARDEMPLELIQEMCGAELGIQLLFVPEAHGGMGGGAFDVYRLCEEMARVDVGVATGVLATFLGSDPIRVGGTDAQRARWLGRIAEDGILMAYGATEPEAGSDLAALRTTATRVEEDGQVVAYVLNGRKQWISNGGVAQAATVLANAPGGPSWFIVESDAEGFGHERPEDKHGIRLSNTAALTLDEVRVEASALVGGVEGQGLPQAVAVFGYTRLMVAAFGLGAGWAALDRAIPYSTERIQAGGPLSEKQGYTHKLIVPHAIDLEAARAYIEQTAGELDAQDGGGRITEGAIAKYLATEAGNRAAEAAIQALGGYGYTREYMVEKIKRDVRITTIYEGTSEIMEMTISRDRWQQHLKTRGQHYHDLAEELRQQHGQLSGCGADLAALALHALAELMERARKARLTRNQHVLFRLGEAVAWAEGAASLARRASAAARDALPEKADRRFDPATLAAVSRVYAREAGLKVADAAFQWVRGGDGVEDAELRAFAEALGLPAIHAAQAGLLADMDRIADALYGR